MADHVRECFLEYAKQCRANILVQRRLRKISVQLAFNAGAILKLIRLPLKGSGQTQVVQHTGPQFRRYPAYCLNGRVDVRNQRPGLLDECLLMVVQLAGQPGKVEFATRQRLAQLVMHLAGNSCPFLFPHCLQIHRKRAQLRMRLPQLLLSFPVLRPIFGLTQRAVDRGHQSRQTRFQHIIRGAAFQSFDRDFLAHGARHKNKWYSGTLLQSDLQRVMAIEPGE